MLLPRERATVALARATTRRVARTFALACRLLPAGVRDDVYLLYLVFRTVDDLVDEGRPEARARVAAVEAWCRGGDPETTEARILADLDRRHALPRDALLDFCRGMRDDLDGRALRTEADLDAYCYRVAGTVGVVMAAVLGTRGDPAQARTAAAALGMAMQRTNVLRDIDEDAAMGRTYLAQETIRRFGPPAPGARAALLADQIARADALYATGIAGIGALQSGGPAVRAAAIMYREILRQLERDGLGARGPGRASVSGRRKLLALGRALRR